MMRNVVFISLLAGASWMVINTLVPAPWAALLSYFLGYVIGRATENVA